MAREKKGAERKKVLVLGGGGYVGKSILPILSKSFDLTTPEYPGVDITSIDSLSSFIVGGAYDVVINLAAHTNLAEAEKQREDETGDVWKINVEGAGNVARACKQGDAFLIHISTDAVFEGTKEDPGPRKEIYECTQELTENIGWYGFTKAVAEQVVEKNAGRFCIVRISYPFGGEESKDLVLKTIRYIKNGYQLFSDQIATPTYLPDLAKALRVIIEREVEEVFHVATHPPLTFFELGKHIKDKVGLRKSVLKGSVFDFIKETSLPRPVCGGLSCKSTQEKLGLRFCQWQKAVDKTLKRNDLL